MYVALFNVAGFAMLGWLLLILLPAWKVTRWIARTAVFPVFLSILYLVGITAVPMKTGPGLMSDFGNAQGVLRLLQNPDIALVAWIHILAFDQVVGMLIYHDNMENRYIPLWVQSVLLTAVLFVGPLAMLLYLLLRFPKKRVRDRERLRGTAARPGAPAPSPAAATV